MGTQYPDRLQQLSWKAPAEECSVLSQLVPNPLLVGSRMVIPIVDE